MFHVSPTPNIDVLLPFSSAEDIIDGEIVWDDDSKNIFKKCVSFGKTVIGCLMDVPMNSGYIYIPDEDIKECEIRHFWKEASELHILSLFSKEVRIYRPVKVLCIGTFNVEHIFATDGYRRRYKINIY